MVDKRGRRVLTETSLLVSIYHITRLSPIFSTGLQMTLQSQYCTPLKKLDINDCTHSSCRRDWFTCKAPANSWTLSPLISFLLRLQNVRKERWFIYLHECTKNYSTLKNKTKPPSLNEIITKGLSLSKVLPLIYAAVLQTLNIENWTAACEQG